MASVTLKNIKGGISMKDAELALCGAGVSNYQAEQAVANLSRNVPNHFVVETNDPWGVNLYNYFDLELSQAVSVRLHRMLFPGEKIATIKELRAATNMGLKDSKDIVDAVHVGDSRIVNVMSVDRINKLKDWFDLKEVSPNGSSVQVGNNKEEAMKYMAAFAKDLLDEKKWESAQNICNLLSILKTVEEYQ
jgi:ribosomal protein L7/L12